MLNIISEKLNLPRKTTFNTSPDFNEYVKTKCKYSTENDEEGLPLTIPLGSKIITSEDIFNNILSIRHENQLIEKRTEQQKKEYHEAKYSKINFKSMEDLDWLKKQNAARQKTATSFVTERVGRRVEQFSNGETALDYFNKAFESGRLYILDEPENSLSPIFQLQLSNLITECAHYLDCQFIIASHSPFILSIQDAKIYDLDFVPTQCREWYELENMQIYFELFKKYEVDFQ